jgi:aspartate 4-decarboxylase
VSFANLEDDVYDDIGRAIRAIAHDYVHAYRAAHQSGSTPAVPEPAWPEEWTQ